MIVDVHILWGTILPINLGKIVKQIEKGLEATIFGQDCDDSRPCSINLVSGGGCGRTQFSVCDLRSSRIAPTKVYEQPLPDGGAVLAAGWRRQIARLA